MCCHHRLHSRHLSSGTRAHSLARCCAWTMTAKHRHAIGETDFQHVSCSHQRCVSSAGTRVLRSKRHGSSICVLLEATSGLSQVNARPMPGLWLDGRSYKLQSACSLCTGHGDDFLPRQLFWGGEDRSVADVPGTLSSDGMPGDFFMLLSNP